MKELRINRDSVIEYGCEFSEDSNKALSGLESVATEQYRYIPTRRYIQKLQEILTKSSSPELLNLNYTLPPNCRYHSQLAGGSHLFVIEEEPQFRTILYGMNPRWMIDEIVNQGLEEEYNLKEWKKQNPSPPYKFLVAVPYVIYVIVLNSTMGCNQMQVFVRPAQIQSIKDYLCIIPLNNLDSSQGLCMASPNYDKYPRTHSGRIAALITSFWQSVFNDDYISNSQLYEKEPYIRHLLTWQYMSQKDPMFIYQVEWQKYRENLEKVIRRIHSSYDDKNRGLVVSYGTLFSPFTEQSETKHESEDGEKLVDNVTNSYIIDDLIIYVGDTVTINGKRYVISSFIGDPEFDDEIMFAQLHRENSDVVINYKLNSKSVEYLKDLVIQDRYMVEVEVNDLKLKRGDIIKYLSKGLNRPIYKKVKYIRTGLDGNLEARTNNSFLKLEEVNNLEVMEVENLEFENVVLVEGNEYLIDTHYLNSGLRRREEFKIVSYTISVEYRELDINSDGSLKAMFKGQDGSTYNVPVNYIDQLVWSKEGLGRMPRTGFRVMAHIVRPAESYGKVYRGKTRYITENTSIERLGAIYIDNFLYNDGTTFVMESFDTIDTFSIGDRVVAANWQNPVDMLKIRTIIGFVYNDETHTLNVTLQDKHGQITSHPLIYRSRSSAALAFYNLNSLRHISTEYDGIKSGTKIKARETLISGFPKKDTNIIIGFLTDTGGDIPLVLCSNCLTLWADEMKEKFEFIERTDPRWDKLDHSQINIDKIIPQPGDIVATNISGTNINHPGYLLARPEPGSSTMYSYGLTKSDITSSYPFDKFMRDRSIFHGFLNPRYTQRQQDEMYQAQCLPNFKGMATPIQNFTIHLPIDERRLLTDV